MTPATPWAQGRAYAHTHLISPPISGAEGALCREEPGAEYIVTRQKSPINARALSSPLALIRPEYTSLFLSPDLLLSELERTEIFHKGCVRRGVLCRSWRLGGGGRESRGRVTSMLYCMAVGDKWERPGERGSGGGGIWQVVFRACVTGVLEMSGQAGRERHRTAPQRKAFHTLVDCSAYLMILPHFSPFKMWFKAPPDSKPVTTLRRPKRTVIGSDR